MRHGRFITLGVAAAAAMAISPAIAAAAPSPIADDLSAGTADGTWIVEPGELRLKPTTVNANFDSALPADWLAYPWTVGGTGAGTVSAGSLSVDGARVHDTDSTPRHEPGQVLEFRGRFSADVFENVGLGNTFNEAPWAMFGTGNGDSLPYGLYARTSVADPAPAGSPSKDELIVGISPADSHVYRIEWSTTEVTFFVDGEIKATHVATWPATTKMRPVVSDFRNDERPVVVDWLGMSPSGARTGTFESRVLSGDDARTAWGTLTPTGSSTGVSFETHTRNSGGTWSAYEALGPDNAIKSPVGIDIQYRATLTTAAGNGSPSLAGVTLTHAIAATPAASATDSATTESGSGEVLGSTPDTLAPKVKIAPRSVRASRRGIVRLGVTCPVSEVSCKVDLKLKRGSKAVARKVATIDGGETLEFKLTLKQAARLRLAERGRLNVTAVAKTEDAAGNRKKVTRNITLRPHSS